MIVTEKQIKEIAQLDCENAILKMNELGFRTSQAVWWLRRFGLKVNPNDARYFLKKHNKINPYWKYSKTFTYYSED